MSHKPTKKFNDNDDDDDDDDGEYCKVWDHFQYTSKFRGAAHKMSNLRHKTWKEIPAELHKQSNFDYHFAIRVLTEEFEWKSWYLGATTDK